MAHPAARSARLASDPLSSTHGVRGGGNGSGMFKSDDGGDSWVATNFGLSNLQIRAVVLDPKIPTTLYAGTTGTGVFKSTDGGASWVPSSAGLTNPVVTALAIDTQTFTVLYAGTHGSGVFRSLDGGASWFPANTGLSNAVVTSLAIDPQTPAILYAGTNGGRRLQEHGWRGNVGPGEQRPLQLARHQPRRRPLRCPPSLCGDQRRRCLQEHESRRDLVVSVNNGLVNLAVTALAINPQTSTTLYAGTNGGGVFRSTNGGGSWAPLNAGLSNQVVNALAVTVTGTCLHAGTSNGVFDFAILDDACSPAPPVTAAGFVNISTRGLVGTGDDVMIGGFIITGSASKTVLVRALGPSLASFGVPGRAGEPVPANLLRPDPDRGER